MKRLSTANLMHKKHKKEAIVMLTCYDATFARLLDQAEIDCILIGDSLGMVIQGHEHTVPVTLEDVIYHSRAVARGCHRPHLVGDLPFGSYQASSEQALRSATRLLKEGGVQSVKLEGGGPIIESVARMTQVGIPVMGHLGLTPQSVHQLGGYKIQAKQKQAAEQLVDDALSLQEAGAFSLVLEGIPLQLAQQVSQRLTIPCIGIGAGPYCDGQVLVIYDLLGLDERFNPKFLKKYANLAHDVVHATTQYAQEVRSHAFPSMAHSHSHTQSTEAIKIVS
jgi:3-methyl-2-oxobutanoate hydroxymethyltransferase